MKEVNYTPIPREGRVIVEPIIPEEDSKLYLSETIQKPNQGIVKAVSEDVKDLNVGDLVQFNENSGVPVIMNNKGFLIMRSGDIWVKFKEV